MPMLPVGAGLCVRGARAPRHMPGFRGEPANYRSLVAGRILGLRGALES